MKSNVRTTLLAMSVALVAATHLPAQSGTKPAMQPAASSGTKAESQAAVAATAQQAKPLKVGDALPAVDALADAKGGSVSLADATKGKTSVVVFYRGGWCPYCNTHLADLARIQPELAAGGVQILAVSPDSPESLAKYGAEHPLPYTLLSDSQHKAMKAFGVAFVVDGETQAKLKGYGIDLAAASGNSEQVLPVPSVFVIDKDGKVSFAHANADYTKRLGGDEILAAAGIAPAAEGSGTKEPAAGSGSKAAAPAEQEPGSGSK